VSTQLQRHEKSRPAERPPYEAAMASRSGEAKSLP
jgi:hypothetical protein